MGNLLFLHTIRYSQPWTNKAIEIKKSSVVQRIFNFWTHFNHKNTLGCVFKRRMNAF